MGEEKKVVNVKFSLTWKYVFQKCIVVTYKGIYLSHPLYMTKVSVFSTTNPLEGSIEMLLFLRIKYCLTSKSPFFIYFCVFYIQKHKHFTTRSVLFIYITPKKARFLVGVFFSFFFFVALTPTQVSDQKNEDSFMD